MEQKEITIGQLRRNIALTSFQTRYMNLITGDKETLSEAALLQLLKISVIFLNYGDSSMQRLGYRIIVRYSLLFEDLKPLYDVSINKGFIPISRLIETQLPNQTSFSDGFFNSYFSSYQDNFLQNTIYLSYGQKKLIKFSDDNKGNFALVAPTSYGKSEIIINKVTQNLNKKVCIIVPSKALLAQTKRRLFSSPFASEIGRIITHPEMYRGDETQFVAVLTQERLLRLLQKNQSVGFDIVLIDEAHNLFKKDSRAVLLVQVILILKKRNASTVLNFFSPFISDEKNLKIPYADYLLEGQHSNEFIKIERYYTCDLTDEKKLFIYDQFLNSFTHYKQQSFSSNIDLINNKKAKKNIVYLNKPRDVVDFALKLAANNVKNQTTSIIDELTTAIADFLHPDYNLLKCIKNGVAYHHGGMPEIVRLYVESIFSKNPELQFIVTSSTLLEGVNIPAEKIFLLTTRIGRKNFSRSEFKNLIGRICRFSEVFDKDNGRLEMLEPEIFLIKSEYENRNANHRSFLEDKAKSDLKLSDDVENILLKDTHDLKGKEIQEVHDTLEYLENIEPNTVILQGAEYVQSDIAQLCYRNNVYDFDIKLNEGQLNQNLELYIHGEQIADTDSLMETIHGVFFDQVDITENSVSRLNNLPARKFYSMILDWRTTSSSFKEMIGKFTAYWNSLANPVIFFGSAWGEMKREENDLIPLYINLSTKTASDMVNLAILKIKDEQDYIEFNLLKYIEILFELGMVEYKFYEKIKYGSSDPKVISLLKNGFSIELAKLLIDSKYRDLITFNLESDDILINEFIVSQMKSNQENDILIFEIMYHIRYTN